MTAALWDHHADTYDALFAPLTGYIARGMFRMVERALPRGAQVLDVACGSGAVTLPALERAAREDDGGLVVATDWSPAMLRLTERAARARGIPEALYRCEVQNGEALTYADASFDAVLSCFGIFLFDDRRAGWREAARVLRPGGTFATTVWQGPQTNEMLRAQMLPVAAALPERLRQPKAGGWIEISDAASLTAELEATGAWRDLRCVPFHASLVLDDWGRAWAAMQNNPVMGELLRRCTADELEAVRRAVFASFLDVAGGEGLPLAFESVCNVVVATRR